MARKEPSLLKAVSDKYRYKFAVLRPVTGNGDSRRIAVGASLGYFREIMAEQWTAKNLLRQL
jgi:hypothetical protein